MYMNNADEINSSLFYRLQTFHFRDVETWIEVALQVLTLVNWNPECSNPLEQSAHQILPPSFTHCHFFPGNSGNETAQRKDEKEERKTEKTTVTVYTGVAVIDKIGATACIISYRGRVTYRGLYIHGGTITKVPPAFLPEAAVLHALRALHEWMEKTKEDDEIQIKRKEVHAGD